MSTGPTKHRLRAFTLPEFLVAVGIGMMALAATAVMWGFASRSCAEVLNYMGMADASRQALDRLSQQIRNAKTVSTFSEAQLVLLDQSNASVTFSYDSAAKTLSMTSGGITKVLLTGCSSLKFGCYQTVPSAGTFDLAKRADSPWRVIDVAWTCSRTLSGNTRTMEYQTSAKVVVRNRNI